MKSSYVLSARTLLCISATVLSVFFFNTPASANDHETQCFNNVQGKIPWSRDKLNWEPDNVKQLCKGTVTPEEPGKCFLTISTGRVEWGKGTDWEWKNVINLCSGTNDANKTIDCFNKGISSKADWRDVILLCQRADDSLSNTNVYLK